MWCRWMILAFLTNGLSQFGIRILQDFGLARSYGFLYLSFWYLTGLLAAVLVFAMKSEKLLRREILLGSLMGLFSVSLCFMLTKAVGAGVPGVLVFPVSIGGSLSLVTLLGVVVLREYLSVYGYLGIASGIAGLVLLSTV